MKSWLIDPATTLVCVWTPPTGLVDFEMMKWLWEHFPRENVRRGARHNDVGTDIESRLNEVLTGLRGSQNFHDFVFLDHDMRPDRRSELMFQTPGDVVGCGYDTGNPASWARPEMIHSGFFRLSADALRRIEPPYFLFPRTAAGVRTGCLCGLLVQKAREAGLTTCHAGWAEHAKARSWCG